MSRLGRLLGRLATPRAGALLAAALGFTIVLVVVQLQWGPLHRLDVRIDNSLNRSLRDQHAQVTWWKAVSTVLHPTVLRIVAVLAAVALWLRGQRLAAVFVAVAMGGAALLETTAKVLVGRARPAFDTPLAFAAGQSFPSGHAMTSFVAFGVLVALVSSRWRAVAVGAAVVAVPLVGFSRLALGVHYLSDVLAAWLLGAAWLLATHWIFEARAPDRALIRRRSAPPAAPPASDRPPRK